MNIGFFDPISERWIKPRPEREPEIPPAMSLGEALLAATEAAALKLRNEKIWAITRQVAEGCNSVEAVPAQTEWLTPEEVGATYPDAPSNLQWDNRPIAEQVAEIWDANTAPIAIEPPPDYVPEFSLGYIYWKPKDDQ